MREIFVMMLLSNTLMWMNSNAKLPQVSVEGCHFLMMLLSNTLMWMNSNAKLPQVSGKVATSL